MAITTCNRVENSMKAVVGKHVVTRVNPKQRRQPGCVHVQAASNGANGGNVLDMPITLPKYDNKGMSQAKKPPVYRVLLHNDDINQREYVVKVLLKVVEGLRPDDAVNIMNEAHVSGIALVICCQIALASRYCHGLRNNGLISSLEPSS